ncbi:hypothetical protein DUNSADRAFT_4320 [Dunaliella salina]|uniref:C2HC zinc finger plants domain-containing protein n=1 Tax=Dunaliella salina TaxID=3046 RepID=A0ABQ7H7M3_DUNSA|nr:hypothetical protein DUNSADRAFT_4320 [Dunaliella salina]|eukprot:KAF5842861.1 hypothetical protein DUNSADRAFT_4320 [Dunaliella salina]
MQLEQSHEAVKCLNEARRALEAGSVQHATKHLLQAIRLHRGEQEAAASMSRIVAALQHQPSIRPVPKGTTSDVVDDISALFQQISLQVTSTDEPKQMWGVAEPPPSLPLNQQPPGVFSSNSWTPSSQDSPRFCQQGLQPLSRHHKPILMETGREAMADCAMQSGTCFICPRCQGIVPVARRAQHDEFWCPQISQSQGAAGGGLVTSGYCSHAAPQQQHLGGGEAMMH